MDKVRIKWQRFAFTLLLITGALLSLSCGGKGNRPNVLLISVDTLRPDRLGCYGYSRPTSPAIDRLAGEGTLFTEAYSQAGWTLPSMATILTGRYPKDHHAIDFNYSLDPSLPTLASLLKERGYDTRGFVSHVLLGAKYGLDRGFVHFDDSVLNRGDPHKISTSKELTELALRDLKSLKEPFFVWIHYFDPHFAYLPHPQWASFGDTDSDRYDQEIAYTDSFVGQLLDFFRKKASWKRTLVVFTADHGEEFGEHGGEYHETCYQEVLRVPLILRVPGSASARQAARTEQIDLMPTILDYLHIPLPGPLPGRDLLATAGPQHPTFVERDRPPGFRQRCLLDGPLKLIRVEPRDTTLIPLESRTEYSEVHNLFAGTYLYDLDEDPKEQVNLFAEGDPRGEKLLAELAAQFLGTAAIPKGNVVVDQEMREKLRSLGYIR